MTLLSSAPAKAEPPLLEVSPSTTAQGGRTQPTAAVSISPTQFGVEQISEAEIDRHIKSLGDLADRAYKDGDKAAARSWTDQMMAAIYARTPAHQARLQADIDRRIDELSFNGEWAHGERRRLA